MLKNQLILTANRFNPGLFMEQCFSTKTVEDAEDSFVDAKERLLDVNHWGRYCSAPGVTFSLSDGHNRPVSRRARGGDHIQLSIPGSEICCLTIESLEYDDYPDLGMETFTLRLKPCMHSKHSEEDIEESAALIIERRHSTVFSVFNFRNPNQSGIANNDVYANFGLTDVQWNNLLSRFIS